MDDNNLLNDEKLDELGYIKNIDVFSLVDKEFDKKREKQRIRKTIGIASAVIVFVSFIVCLIAVMPMTPIRNNRLLQIFIAYYFISVSMMMLLIIPIKKRRKSY